MVATSFGQSRPIDINQLISIVSRQTALLSVLVRVKFITIVTVVAEINLLGHRSRDVRQRSVETPSCFDVIAAALV